MAAHTAQHFVDTVVDAAAPVVAALLPINRTMVVGTFVTGGRIIVEILIKVTETAVAARRLGFQTSNNKAVEFQVSGPVILHQVGIVTDMRPVASAPGGIGIGDGSGGDAGTHGRSGIKLRLAQGIATGDIVIALHMAEQTVHLQNPG